MLNSPIEEIKSKLDIVEVISQYIKLEKAGTNYKALCPFHKEKAPSFFVSPSRQIWHCFGACNTGGDIFGFVMKMENVDFPEALRLLAKKAGIELIKEDPRLRTEKQRLREICEAATDFFSKKLKENIEVLAYLQKRGLNMETIKEFRLGFAPDSWRDLVSYLTTKGFSPLEIEKAGLAINREEPTEIKNNQYQNTFHSSRAEDYYDRFRSRIIFPLQDIAGDIVGFSGRIFQGRTSLKTIKNIEAVGKYINTPQTLIFDKGKILYGLFKTKKDLILKEATIILEGQMDFLAAWQDGVRNVVAVSGTGLTFYQLAILKRFNNNLILGFDMDEAGDKATERSIALALAKEFNIKVLRLPRGKDIAEFVQETPGRLIKIVAEAEPIMDFYFERAKKMAEPVDLESKKKIVSYFLPKIKKLVNVLDKSFWLERLSYFVNIPQKVLEDELMKIKELPPAEFTESDEKTPAYVLAEEVIINRKEVLGESILALLIKTSSMIPQVKQYLNYFSDFQQKIFKIIESQEEDAVIKEQNDFPEEITNKMNFLRLRGDYEMELLEKSGVSPLTEIEKNLKELKKEAVGERLVALTKMIEDWEKQSPEQKEKDKKDIKKLLEEFNQLSRELGDCY